MHSGNVIDLSRLPVPLLGFCAFSGVGKTTLLLKLIPALTARGLRLAVIKHAHHNFDIDHAAKDSYKLRHAGSTQMLISSSRRWALMRELSENEHELALPELAAQIDFNCADLVLVEGFKNAAIPKIELHRPGLGHPLICENDKNVIAVAADQTCPIPQHLERLDINQSEQISTFICNYFKLNRAGFIRD